MFKFLIILFLISFLVLRVGGFFFRVLAGMSGVQQTKTKPRPRGGNVDIDYNPNTKSSKDGLRGGEYVDYEEVK